MVPPETDQVKNFCTFGSPPASVKVNETACGANTGPGGAAMVTVGHGDTVGTDGGGTGTACERAAIAETAASKAAATKTATVFFIFGESPGSFESHGKHTILRSFLARKPQPRCRRPRLRYGLRLY